MFGWLSRCWGGMGVTSGFEKARLECTYADWASPNPRSLITIMETLRGQNPEMNCEAALNSILTHLEQDDERVNGAFLLKNLVILDFAVEERIFLTKIGNYYNSQLLYLSGQGREMSSYVKDLIASYYVYIKEKARLYSSQSIELANKRNRIQYMEKSPVSNILNEINICFKVQTLILDVSDKFNRGNKSPELIQLIFSSLLKTYLFCYSIVSLALRTFIRRIPTLARTDLEYLGKLATYINKEYTRNFLLFIERNKMIDSFKQIKYNELIILDDKVSTIILDQLAKQDILDRMEIQESAYKIEQINAGLALLVEEVKSEQEEKDEDQNNNQKEKQFVWKGDRKAMEIELRTSGQADEHFFTDFVNFYHESFIIEDEDGQNPKEIPQPELFLGKKYSSAISYKGMMEPKLRKEYTKDESRKFDKNTWDSWENVYSE